MRIHSLLGIAFEPCSGQPVFVVKLSNETIIEASADRVWEIVGRQFARIGEWATAIPASRPSSRAVGDADAPVAGRVCETGLPMFPHVEETIISYDEAGRTLTYEAAGLPTFVGEARNQVEVTPVDEYRARVRFDAAREIERKSGSVGSAPTARRKAV